MVLNTMKYYLIIILLIIVCYYLMFNNNKLTKRVFVVTFEHNCKFSQLYLSLKLYLAGAYKVLSLNIDTLEAPENIKEHIRNTKRGAGYWLWKPYAIKQVLNLAGENDIIIYIDCKNDITHLDQLTDMIENHGILVFKHMGGLYQSAWTKMDAVNYFEYPLTNWCQTEGPKIQFISAFIGFINNNNGRTLIARWAESMDIKNIKLIDDSPGELPNCSDFRESRHDQQMLSLILYKWYPELSNKLPIYNKKYGWLWHEKNTFSFFKII